MDDETLLAVIHRGRPASVSEFATLAHLAPVAARTAVDRLRERGLLGGAGDEITLAHPASWAAETVSARSAELRLRAQEALSDIEKVVADLPAMLRHWSVGEVSADPVPVTVRHGPHASEDLWYETARHDGGTLHAVLPGVARFRSNDPERGPRFARALAGKDAVRVIMPPAAAVEPALQPSIERYTDAGVEYRLLDSPPSWFWVDGDQLSVPFEWGEGSPTSVLGVRNAALAGLALDYFERLWRLSDPVVPTEQAWTPLLKLMRQGITLDTASRTLGINPRTGRRRVAAGMEHYGVSTLFALGVAWAADTEGAG